MAAGSVISPAGQPVGVAGGGASPAPGRPGRVDEALLVDAEAAVAAAAAVLAADGRGAPAVGGAAPARAPGGALEPMRCANRAGATLRAAAAMESPVVGELAFGEVVDVAGYAESSCGRVRAEVPGRGWASAKLLLPAGAAGAARAAEADAWRRALRLLAAGPPPAATPAVAAAARATFDCTSAARDDATVAGLEGLCLGVAALPGSAAVRARRAPARERRAARGGAAPGRGPPASADAPERARAARSRRRVARAPRRRARALHRLAEDLDAPGGAAADATLAASLRVFAVRDAEAAVARAQREGPPGSDAYVADRAGRARRDLAGRAARRARAERRRSDPPPSSAEATSARPSSSGPTRRRTGPVVPRAGRGPRRREPALPRAPRDARCGFHPLVRGVPTKLHNSLSQSNRSRFG